LRNARVTGCGIRKNLRFAVARAAGLGEDQIALIDHPNEVGSDLREALLAEFSPEQIVELTATICAVIAFSKAAIAFGAPSDMPPIEVPTPSPDA
jgi:hypothetical protein